mmetsp:Transcript_66074/g.170091  ORF Transcript_66074/g.170091 Transcript_66074/m.170091 type:complete len:503 (+) Transcript_66074:135-1643(+)
MSKDRTESGIESDSGFESNRASAKGIRSTTGPPGEALDAEKAQELWKLLFGDSPDEDDMRRWMTSTFTFAGKDTDVYKALTCPWGLKQTLGGPCGVYAAVQAFVVRQLLWGSRSDLLPEKTLHRSPSAASTASTAAGTDSETDTPSSSGTMTPASGDEAERPETAHEVEGASSAPVVATAPARVEEACDLQTLVDRLQERFKAQDSRELLAGAMARMLQNALPTDGALVWAEVTGKSQVRVRQFQVAEALTAWLATGDALQTMASPVLSLVCSLVLTRGVDTVKTDMDSATSSLIGVYGHCAQELTNLCITGQAVTNIFDGDVVFEDGDDVLRLRGIHKTPEVGFLSTHEPLRLAEVGQLLKQPRYPLWVVGSATHYTLLLAGDCRANHLAMPAPVSEEDKERVKGAEPCCSACSCARGEFACPSSVRLLHLNGMAVCGNTPSLVAAELQLDSDVTKYEPGPLPEGDQDGNIVAEVLRSRWPGAKVSYPTLGGVCGNPPRLC